MIIGLTGLKNSGKDTVGAYLVKEHKFERRSFADPLKKSLCALLDIPFWDEPKFKNDPTVMVTVGYKNQPNLQVTEFINKEMQTGKLQAFKDFEFVPPDHMWSPIREFTFREIEQRYGDEAHKPFFGEDCWTNIALPMDGFYNGRAIVVTDCRFHVEASRITELGGLIVKVDRREATPETPDMHRSEVEQLTLQYHYLLHNDGTLEELYKNIEHMLEVLVK